MQTGVGIVFRFPKRDVLQNGFIWVLWLIAQLRSSKVSQSSQLSSILSILPTAQRQERGIFHHPWLMDGAIKPGYAGDGVEDTVDIVAVYFIFSRDSLRTKRLGLHSFKRPGSLIEGRQVPPSLLAGDQWMR